MRRAQFAVSGGKGINGRASIGDVLTFDLRTPETADDESLVAQAPRKAGARSNIAARWRLIPEGAPAAV
jgi:hypothetical protein